MPVANLEIRSAKANRFPGLSLVEGEMLDDEQAQIVTCNLGAFDAYMRTIYADWDAFEAWREDRYWLHQGYEGGVPAKWWEIAG
jgi:hypothetical protein